MEEFSSEEKRVLKPFVSNLEENVFVLTNLPEVVKGALFSRYSRSSKSLKRLLLDEFIFDEKMGFKEIVKFQAESGIDQVVAIKKAEEFYDRVLIGFGDDSVAELGGAHLAVENISNICAKFLEDSRIGISPLEKSTRYVLFNKKVREKYLYHVEEGIRNSVFGEKYVELCNELFEQYSIGIEKVKVFLEKNHPREPNVSERAYNSTIKAKACDIMRVFLPAATKTNVGLFGNGRAFEYLLTKMYASNLAEVQKTAKLIHQELNKSIPSFVKRARGEFGDSTINYLQTTKTGLKKIAKEQFGEQKPIENQEVTLVSFDRDAVDKVVAATLYPFTSLPLKQVQEKVKQMSEEEKKEVLAEYFSKRKNRRHKPGRGFEHAFFEFDLLGNYGIFRDLQRHRILTQQKQTLSTFHGFDSPMELKEIGLQETYEKLMKRAADLYREVSEKMPEEAQYLVPFGYRIRWALNINARELFHFIELRSTPQGHADYRRIALKMLVEAQKVCPELFLAMKFADAHKVGLERLEAEKQKDKNIEAIQKKYQ